MKKIIVFSIVASICAVMPGLAFAATVYSNVDYKVKLDYSGLPVQTAVVGSYIPLGDNLGSEKTSDLVMLYLKPYTYRGTNLEAAAFVLSASNTLSSAQACYTISSDSSVPNAQPGPVVTLNKLRVVRGNKWHYAKPNPHGLGAALSHSGEAELYRLFKHGICYEVVLGAVDHTANIAENAHEKQWSGKKIFNYLGAVFNRLRIQ